MTKVYNLYSDSDVLTIDSVPEGPLGSLILLKTEPSTSETTAKKTTYLVCHPYYARSVVKESEMFVIFDYLKAKGYKMESDITQYYPNGLLDFFGESGDSFYSFDKVQPQIRESEQEKTGKRLICKFSFHLHL